MKCRKCGTEFLEGIFCPECGFKNIDEKIAEPVADGAVGEEKHRLAEKERELLEKERRLKEEQERIAEEQHKKEQEQIEKEKLLEAERKRLDAEKADRERAERKAAEEERAVREREEAEKRAREREESEELRKDNERIDSLKSRLMSTRSQEERRKMLSEFDGQLNCMASQKRIEELRNKANQKQPHGSMANWIFGVSVILAIVVTGILGGTGNADSSFLMAVAIWYGLGIPVWIVWRIVLVVQSRSKKFCLNIKHI